MLSDVVSRKLRHPEYWQRPQSQWSVNTWNKYFCGEKRGSYSALILELDTLIECLEPKTQEYQKASALKCQLKKSGRKKHVNKENQKEETLTQGRVPRKRSIVDYAESDAETNSDSDYVEEKSKKRYKCKSRTKRGNTSEEKSKPSRHGSGLRVLQNPMISNNHSKVEPNNPHPRNSSPSRSHVNVTTISVAQQTMTSLDTADIDRCSAVQSAKQALILTPNKPIVTKMMCNEYSPYLICAFNATINYIEKTTDKKTFMEIKKMLQTNDQLILQESLVRKLEAIFETDYSEIESKIIEMTTVKGDSEEARFNFFIRYTLLDFSANFMFKIPRILDRDISERTFIVESLSPIFRAFRNAFPDIKYEWIEKDVASIKVANSMFADNISPRKTDLLVLRLSDGMEVMNTEVSGPPFKNTQAHTVGDVKKLLMMSVCNLCQLFGSNLNCSIKDAKGVKTYNIQIIGDRLTLFSVSLADKKKYLALELATCTIPFSFDSISNYAKIFNSLHPADNIDNVERVQDWLYLPDDFFFYDLKAIPEDIDEVLISRRKCTSSYEQKSDGVFTVKLRKSLMESIVPICYEENRKHIFDFVVLLWDLKCGLLETSNTIFQLRNEHNDNLFESSKLSGSLPAYPFTPNKDRHKIGIKDANEDSDLDNSPIRSGRNDKKYFKSNPENQEVPEEPDSADDGLLRELSTSVKGEQAEVDDNDVVSTSVFQSLARRQKAIRAGLRVAKANQEEILC
ncbi:8526_t:CDS:10 [Funneliformis caledonium]|uniref:8526_t:CDS:1 n=1 Tax=Funneliformis caledonium TaxID=1117310 RepID=A0A9N9CMD1_9GLOM|nr:8526_t:CDS:10 [Funneliformis caledonium]